MTIRKTATDNGFIIFKDQLSLLKLIPDEQLGKSIKLLLENFDELPEKNDIAYEMIATNIRRYREQAKVSSEMAKKRWDTDNVPSTDPMGSQSVPNATIQDNTIQEKNIYNNTGNQTLSNDIERSPLKSCIKKVGDNKKQVLVNSQFSISNVPELQCYVNEMPEDVIHSVEKWLIKNKDGALVDISFITKQFFNFAKRMGRPVYKEAV